MRGCYFLSIDDYEFGLKNIALSKARIASDGQPNFHIYLDNCLHDADGDGLLNGTDKGYGIVDGVPYPTGGTTPGTVSYDRSATPFAGAPVTVSIDDPLTAYKKVLSSAGALRLDAAYAGPLRDELDTLLIDSVEDQESILVAKDSPVTSDPEEPPSNGEQHLADAYGISNNGFGTLNTAAAPTDTDGDGMPDYWELTVGSDPAVQNHNTVFTNNGSIVTASTFFPPSTPAGYTYLEEYLHFCAIPHAAIAKSTAAQPSSITVDLRKYTRGFSVGPQFSISGSYGGTILQFAADGTTPSAAGPIIEFSPTLDYTGRAGFDFNVTDADADSWTQSFAILVSQAPPAFTTDPISNIDAIERTDYVGNSLATYANDPDNTFSKDAGPDWLLVAADGTLSGIPEERDLGENTFTVRVTDDAGLYDTTQMTIQVANTYSGSQAMEDLAGLAAQWLMTDCTDTPACNGADLDGDSDVTISDLLVMADNWLDGAPVMEIVTLQIQENEPGFVAVAGTIDNNNAGYTGDGFANTDNAIGKDIEWTVYVPLAGSFDLQWRYANGGSTTRSAAVSVNTITQMTGIDFALTGVWTTWDLSQVITVSLDKGYNQINLVAETSDGLANIDWMEISGIAPTPGN